jgi:hypothetical protein
MFVDAVLRLLGLTHSFEIAERLWSRDDRDINEVASNSLYLIPRVEGIPLSISNHCERTVEHDMSRQYARSQLEMSGKIWKESRTSSNSFGIHRTLALKVE